MNSTPRAEQKEARSRALWLGRVIVREGARTSTRVVRARTEGPPPDLGAALDCIADPFEQASARGQDVWTVASAAEPVARVRLADCVLAPPVQPSKILGVGRNYWAHAAELGNELPTTPLLFFKPPSCLLAAEEPLRLPRGYERIDFEGELVVVVGRRAVAVAVADAWEHVAGYVLGNDVSCRDLQRSDRQWTRAKGFDGFGPLGAWVRLTPPGWRLPVSEIELQTFVDEEQRQRAPLSAMVFDIPTLLAHISACMTLEPGDLIFTGTPVGFGPLSPGQRVRVACEGLELAGPSTPVV